MRRKQGRYSYEEWKKAMGLHNRFKLGQRRISRILGIPKGTVNSWIYSGAVPSAVKWIAGPSNELGYVIGVLHGDGSVIKVKPKNKPWYDYKIKLGAIDKEFVETFSKAMARLLNRKYKEPWGDKRQRKWIAHYYSKAFCLWYKETEEQGLDGFKPYIEYNKKTVKYYLRGLFDSEGCNYRCKQINLYNTNKELLEYVQFLLKEYFDIVATGPYLVEEAGTTRVINGVESRYNNDCYKIQIARKLHVHRFLEEIGFSIVRKQLGLMKDEKVFVEWRYVEPHELVKLGLFKLPFSNTQ